VSFVPSVTNTSEKMKAILLASMQVISLTLTPARADGDEAKPLTGLTFHAGADALTGRLVFVHAPDYFVSGQHTTGGTMVAASAEVGTAHSNSRPRMARPRWMLVVMIDCNGFSKDFNWILEDPMNRDNSGRARVGVNESQW
jgi:hypothetical protein